MLEEGRTRMTCTSHKFASLCMGGSNSQAKGDSKQGQSATCKEPATLPVVKFRVKAVLRISVYP